VIENRSSGKIAPVGAVLTAAAIAALITSVPEWVRAIDIQTENNEKSALERNVILPLVPDVERLSAPVLASFDDHFRLRVTLDAGETQTAAAGASYFVGSLSPGESAVSIAEPVGSDALQQIEASVLNSDKSPPQSDLAYNAMPSISPGERLPSAETNVEVPLPVSRPFVVHGRTQDKSTPSSSAPTSASSTRGPLFATFSWLQKLLRFKDAAPVLPFETDSRTAVYDIKGHLVYLPTGEKLEAHSGLGKWLDDAQYVNAKDRGPIPPNVYRLALRNQSFHGVQAIRLSPIGSGNMYGRNGMLAHPYMLGANGQSNGCVSIQDYPKFLQAFLRGDFNRLIVVADLAEVSSKAKYAQLGLMARDGVEP
jgi:Tlde1 domain